jgi:hypothetical protein
MIIGVLILGWLGFGYLGCMVAKRGEYGKRWGVDTFVVATALFGPLSLFAWIAMSGFKVDDHWIA